jgi:hypothetical protein
VYHSHLLRRSYREDGKVKKETVGNISHLPDHIIAALRAMLDGKELVDLGTLSTEQSLPHGHVEAALAMMRRLKIALLLDRAPSKQRDLVMAMIAQRILTPGSKLYTTRVLQQSTLPQELGIGTPTVDDLYEALDWLIERQESIERRLARRHLHKGAPSHCMIYRHPTLRAGVVRLRCADTRATSGADHCRSSTACYAIGKAGPSPSRFFKGTPSIPKR